MDPIDRQAAIDELHGKDPSQIWGTADIEAWLNALPSAQPEIIHFDCEAAIETLENTKQKDPFDRYEKQNIGIDWAIEALKALPSVEAIPVEWINDRIASLMEMDNAFASLTANQIRALLDDWRARND